MEEAASMAVVQKRSMTKALTVEVWEMRVSAEVTLGALLRTNWKALAARLRLAEEGSGRRGKR